MSRFAYSTRSFSHSITIFCQSYYLAITGSQELQSTDENSGQIRCQFCLKTEVESILLNIDSELPEADFEDDEELLVEDDDLTVDEDDILSVINSLCQDA